MAKNTMADLHDHLMAQLERLVDEDLEGEALEHEMKRSRAVANVAKTMINNGRLVLDAEKHKEEFHGKPGAMPKMLENRKE